MADFDNTAPRASKAKRAPRAPHVMIDVTQEIIDTAVRRDSKNCMIAETIMTTVPTARNVLVDTSTIRWSDRDKGLRYTYITPTNARDAIFKFDFGRKVEPFSFLLRGGWVSVIRGSMANDRMPLASWEKVKEDVKKIREERGISWDETADEIGLNSATLSSKISSNAPPPSPVNIDKIEAWTLKQTGGKPAPRIKSLAHKVAGRVRKRSEKTTKTTVPELIGGRPPATPANMTMRQYGLRAFDWKIEEPDA